MQMYTHALTRTKGKYPQTHYRILKYTTLQSIPFLN